MSKPGELEIGNIQKADIKKGEVVVSVKNVSKKFCKNLKRSMAYGIIDLYRNVFGLDSNTGVLRKDEFWSVDDVSLDLKRGEVLGLIGVNGSGKSTLLRLIAGIFPPDKGEILVRGKVGALIAVGAGFHPHMTGLENIYLNGTILGMSRAEIDTKLHKIVNFAEIGDFMDAPVATYSSGMIVRLGFSIAMHIEPDIMLIDEVLAVGDLGFRAKCFNAIDKILEKAAVIFVSHDMPQVARICSRVIVLDQGKIAYKGKNVTEGLQYYQSKIKTQEPVITGNNKASIDKIEFESKSKKNINKINYADDLTTHLYLSINKEIKAPIIGIYFLNQEGQIVAQCNSGYHNIEINNMGFPLHVKIRFSEVIFNPGKYKLCVSVAEKNKFETLVMHYAIKDLEVRAAFMGQAPMQYRGEWEIHKAESFH